MGIKHPQIFEKTTLTTEISNEHSLANVARGTGREGQGEEKKVRMSFSETGSRAKKTREEYTNVADWFGQE